jgi:hypothetical protein
VESWKGDAVFTIRNLGGVSLFLAGTTWLWLTPAFASRGVSTSGVMWVVTRGLCRTTMVGFAVATWGLFGRHSWWEAVALGATGLGVAALLVYILAASAGGEPTGTVTWNAFVHVVMAVGVLVLLLVPQLESWVDQHVMGT